MLQQDQNTSVYRILLNLFTPPPPPPPPLPTVTITSFEFVGTLGGTTATPTVQFTSTDATSASVTLFRSASTFDAMFSVLNTQTPTPSGTNTVNYTTTIADRWYYYTVIVTNATGSASASTIHKQNYAGPPPPTLTFTLSSTYLQAPGTVTAKPSTQATVDPDQGVDAQINWTLYQYNGFGFPNDIYLDSGTIYGPLDDPQLITSTTYTPLGVQYYYYAEITGGPDGTEDDESTLSELNNEPA
jgi:hypothetical protein